MDRLAGPVVDIEADTESVKAIAHLRMILVDDGLRSGVLLQRLVGNSGSMFVAATHIHNVFADGPQVPNINIGRNICACQVTDVLRSVSIGQGRGNSMSPKLHESV